MTRVCFINPILFSSQALRTRSLKSSKVNVSMSYFPPLGLTYIAGFLEKNGTEVLIIDRSLLMRKFSFDLTRVNYECQKKIKEFSPDYIGITSTTPTYVDVNINIIKMAKEACGNARIMLGGPHATALPEYILESNSDIDMVCRGEGEMIMLEIVKGTPFSQIAGLTYREGDKIVHNVERPPHSNIDDFYPPARHLIDMKSYCEPNPYIMRGNYLRGTTIFTSRGCPYDCTFCAGKVALGRKVRFHSNNLVLDEITNLVENYGVEGLYFADDMFEANKERVRKICGMMIDSGLHKKLKWIAQVRANTADESTMRLMKEAGCIQIEFGFETGSQRTLDILNKKITVAQNYEAARVAKKVGLPFQANIIVGVPGENIEDLKQTEKFMRDINARWIGFGEFIPLPGSKIFETLLNSGKVTIKAAEKLEEFNFTNISDEMFVEQINKIKRTIVYPARIKSFLINNIKSIRGSLFVIKFAVASFFFSILGTFRKG